MLDLLKKVHHTNSNGLLHETLEWGLPLMLRLRLVSRSSDKMITRVTRDQAATGEFQLPLREGCHVFAVPVRGRWARADGDLPGALVALAAMYASGRGVPQDSSKALKLTNQVIKQQ